MNFYFQPFRFSTVVLILFFLSISGTTFGFEPEVLRGFIKDAISSDPIPFCHINNTNNEKGVYSKLDGEFEIEVRIGDQLVISCMGYKNDTITLAELGVRHILLMPSIKLMEEVLITNSLGSKRVKLGYSGKSKTGGYSTLLKIPESPKPDHHSDVSCTIEYAAEYEGRILKNINIGGILNSKEGKYMYAKVKFFRVDDEEILGGEPLVDKNVFDYGQLTKNGLITINIEEYAIELPEKGIKIIVELLGLYDENMNSVAGEVILYSAKEKTPVPRSYRIFQDGSKGAFLSNGKGKYLNLNFWIEI